MRDGSAPDVARRAADAMWAEDRASQGLGMTITAIGDGEAELRMPVTEAMLNGHGTCHGGFIFALADSAFAFACNSHNDRAVAQNCTITYLAPARRGDVLVASAREISLAGRSGITDVTVTTEAGARIAEFRGLSRTISGHVVPELAGPGGGEQ